MKNQSPARRWDFLKGNIGVMLLSSGIWNIASSMTWPFYALYVLGLGGSHIDIGFISAVGAIARIIPTLFGGYLADTIGRKKILYSMSFLMAANILVFAYAPDFRFLFIATIFGALFAGIRDPAFQSLLADSTTPNNRATTMALWQVIPGLFGLLSPYLIGLVIDDICTLQAMRYAYILTFFLATFASYLRYKYINETLENGRKVNTNPKEAVYEIITDFKTTIRNLPKALWTFLLIDFIFTFAWAVTEPYFVIYAKEEVGVLASEWGAATTLVMIIRLVLMPPLAGASDRYGRMKFILLTMFLWPISFYIFSLAEGYQDLLKAQILLTISGCIGDPAWEAIFYDYSPKEHRGRFSAIAQVSWSLIWSAGNVVGGAIYQGYPKPYVFYLSTGLFIIGAFIALLKLKEPESREK